jgi:hypothetical protein
MIVISDIYLLSFAIYSYHEKKRPANKERNSRHFGKEW